MCVLFLLQHFVEVLQEFGIILLVADVYTILLHSSIWQTIKDVDSLCVAGHHDNNALLVDGHRAVIYELGRVVGVIFACHRHAIQFLNLRFEGVCLALTAAVISNCCHVELRVDEHVVDHCRRLVVHIEQNIVITVLVQLPDGAGHILLHMCYAAAEVQTRGNILCAACLS